MNKQINNQSNQSRSFSQSLSSAAGVELQRVCWKNDADQSQPHLHNETPSVVLTLAVTSLYCLPSLAFCKATSAPSSQRRGDSESHDTTDPVLFGLACAPLCSDAGGKELQLQTNIAQSAAALNVKHMIAACARCFLESPARRCPFLRDRFQGLEGVLQIFRELFLFSQSRL